MCARSTHTRVCILLKHSIYGVGMRGKSLHGEAKNVLDDGKKNSKQMEILHTKRAKLPSV